MASNLKLRVPVPFPAQVAGAGGIAVEKAGGVWTIAPDFSQLGQIAASAVSDPATKQIWIFDPASAEYNVLTLGGLGDALYLLTSTTSISIGAGSKTFATQANKDIGLGSWVLIVSNAAPTTNYMLGQVASYDTNGNLVVTVTYYGGIGTHADWTIRASSPPGLQGRSAGYSYAWLTATTSTDPGAGNIKADNATFASIAHLYISETDADGNALASEIATWAAGTSTLKGRIKIYDPIAPTNFMAFDVTGLTDNGAWDTLAVVPVATGGTFAVSEALRITFTPKGDKGDTGVTGGAANVSGMTAGQLPVAANANTISSSIAYDAAASASTVAVRDANRNASINNLLEGYATTATAAGITTLTAGSAWAQFFTGATTQTCKLPDCTTLVTGFSFLIVNNSTGAVTVQDAGADNLLVIAPGTWATVECTNIGSANGTWNLQYMGIAVASGKKLAASNSLTLAGTDGTTMTFPATSSTVLTAGNTATIATGFTTSSLGLTAITGANQALTPDPTQRNFQHVTLNGSSLTGTFTVAPPSGVCTMLLEVTNGGSGPVGATLSTSGFTKVTGDTYATTNGNKYLFFITRSNSYSHLHVQALQ